MIAACSFIRPFRSILQVPYVDEGLGAVIFTADGDMRQALNNLQATYYGFGMITPEHVFKVRQVTTHITHPIYLVLMCKVTYDNGPVPEQNHAPLWSPI